MNENNGYRVVTTERMPDRTERFVGMSPEAGLPPLTREAAVQYVDDTLARYTRTLHDYREDTLPHALLPTGPARMKVVTDEQARDLKAARVLTGAAR